SAFQPKRASIILPHPGGVAAKFFAAMKTPLFLVEIGPVTPEAMFPKQVYFFVMWQRNVFHWMTELLCPQSCSKCFRMMQTQLIAPGQQFHQVAEDLIPVVTTECQ